MKTEKHLRTYANTVLAQAGAHEVRKVHQSVQGIVEAAEQQPAQPIVQQGPARPPTPDLSHFRDTNEGGIGQVAVGRGDQPTATPVWL